MKDNQANGRTSALPYILKTVITIAAAAGFFTAALLSSIELTVYGIPGYFPHEFEKYDVYDALPMSRTDADRVMKQTMEYLRGDRESLEDVTAAIDRVGVTAFYNADEISHMKDVRDMFVRGLRVRNAAAVLFLGWVGVCAASRKRCKAGEGSHTAWLLNTFAAAELVMIAACAAAALYAATDFTGFFTRFHMIFFPQGNWAFDPAQSRMINMLPEGIFRDTALYSILVFVAAELAAICVARLAAARLRA